MQLGDEQNTNNMLHKGRDSTEMVTSFRTLLESTTTQSALRNMWAKKVKDWHTFGALQLSKSLEEGSTVEFKIYDWPAYRAHKELPSHFDLKEELDPGKNYFKFWKFLNYTDQVSVRNTIALVMQMDKPLKNKHQVEWTISLLREETYALVVEIFDLHAKGMLKGMKAFNAAAAAAAEAREDAGPSKRGTKPGTSKRGGRSRSLGKAVAPSLVLSKKGKKVGMSMNLWMSVCGLTNCDIELNYLDFILREVSRLARILSDCLSWLAFWKLN